jgi:hypothetical protein
MATEKQIAASRENGKKSRGPLTPEGKRNSSRNSLRHGMLARTIVLDGESRERFNELCKSLTDELQPATSIEHLLVQKMAVAHWRQMRFWNIEKASMDYEVSKQSAEHAGADPSLRDALALRTLGSVGQTTSQFEVRFDRQFDRALSRFERLREHPIRRNEPGN